MIVTVTGERDWTDKQQVWDELEQLLIKHVRAWCGEVYAARATFILRHGSSGNVDLGAHDWGKKRGVTIERFHADWYPDGQYFAGAGPVRNKKMAEALPRADLCLAFWSGKMRKRGDREYSGTLNMIQQALHAGIRVQIVPPKELS